MAYNQRYYLTRVVQIQDIVLEHQKKGVTQEWTYRNVIRPQFHISRSTFYNYLAISAPRAKLKALEQEDVLFTVKPT